MRDTYPTRPNQMAPGIKPAANQAGAKARNIAFFVGPRQGFNSVTVRDGKDVATVLVNEMVDLMQAIERGEAN